MFRFAILVCLVTLTACSDNRPAKTSVHEVAGSEAERVARVSAIIGKHHALPTAVRDAQFVEEQLGDGVLGPSDFRAFSVVEVVPEDLAQWTAILKPLGSAADYAAPAQPRAWWIGRDAFAALEFYEPDVLSGRQLGWIGVSRATGRIFIFTFTT